VSGESNNRSLSELQLKSEYRSDQDDFVKDFYVPCLERSNNYWRAAGYFTSRSLAIVAQGLSALIHAGGKMRLVVSPLFTEEDLDSIKKGYAAREDVVAKSLLRAFEFVSSGVVEDRLGYLAWLIAEEKLEIRVAVPLGDEKVPKSGIYHEKLGLFFDGTGNTVAFTGSPNETAGGLVENFETIDVFHSWDDSHGRVNRKRANFERLWNDLTTNLAVIEFPEAVRQKLLKFRPKQVIPESLGKNTAEATRVDRWRHQKDAINEFLKSERGILEMATGTGKTKTSLRICEYREAYRTDPFSV
jgi:PLD-like domain/Type III restriction enzyme, res subunit